MEESASKATYKLTTTVILHMEVDKEEVGKTSLAGSLTRQTELNRYRYSSQKSTKRPTIPILPLSLSSNAFMYLPIWKFHFVVLVALCIVYTFLDLVEYYQSRTTSLIPITL